MRRYSLPRRLAILRCLRDSPSRTLADGSLVREHLRHRAALCHARTAWRSHLRDQMLIVTEGLGRVQVFRR